MTGRAGGEAAVTGRVGGGRLTGGSGRGRGSGGSAGGAVSGGVRGRSAPGRAASGQVVPGQAAFRRGVPGRTAAGRMRVVPTGRDDLSATEGLRPRRAGRGEARWFGRGAGAVAGPVGRGGGEAAGRVGRGRGAVPGPVGRGDGGAAGRVGRGRGAAAGPVGRRGSVAGRRAAGKGWKVFAGEGAAGGGPGVGARSGRRAAPPLRLTRRGRAVVVIGMVLLALGGFWLGTRTAGHASVAVMVPEHPGLPWVDVRTGDTAWGIADAVARDGRDP